MKSKHDILNEISLSRFNCYFVTAIGRRTPNEIFQVYEDAFEKYALQFQSAPTDTTKVFSGEMEKNAQEYFDKYFTGLNSTHITADLVRKWVIDSYLAALSTLKHVPIESASNPGFPPAPGQ